MPRGMNKMAYAFGRAVHNVPGRSMYYDPRFTPRKYNRAVMLDDAEQLRWQEMANRAGYGRDFRAGWLREELAPPEGDRLDFYNDVYDNEFDETGYIIDDAIDQLIARRAPYIAPRDIRRYRENVRRMTMDRLRNSDDLTDVLDWLEYER